MTAGLLAQVDRDLRRLVASLKIKPTVAGNRKFEQLDRDPQWHTCLAKLGHALHQVEDFFAHSNWIELAVQRLGPEYADKFLPPKASPAFIDRSRSVVEKRLVRHLTAKLPNWRDHDPERWVVTGYFDIRDTIVSLLHVSEEAWGGHVPVCEQVET